jgi:hypothetical protein
VFYPLIPLLYQADTEMQEPLLLIFAELPTLDDAAIEEHLHPPAFIESSRAELECRRRVLCILT